MATKIIHKKSSTASSVPAAGSLEPGEIAVNLADKKLYTKTTGGTVIELADGDKLAGIEAGATADQTKADIDALGIDAATLDGIDSSSFIRSDAADTKTSGDLAFSDNVKATFGGASDLQIYHDGSNSYIWDAGDGDLILRGSTGIKLQSSSGVLEYLSTNSSTGSVELKLSGATKLATTTTGVDITGTLTSDGLTVDGTVTGNIASFINDGDSTNAKGIKIQGGTDNNFGENYKIEFFDGDGTASGRISTNTGSINIEAAPVTINDGGGDYDFRVESATNTHALFVDASTSNVGIGASSPATALDVDGSITVSGTVDGRDVATDGTKLDGIEAGADVTDATNVTTALGSISIEALSDVNTMAPTDGQVLAWDNANSRWDAADAAGGGGTLDSLSDTTITSNSAGEILKWNGSAWINNTLAEAGIQPAGSYLTGNQTITLSGDVTGTGTTSIAVSLAADSVGSSEIAANAVGASELNVVGNGTAGQLLSSDGDGSFSWVAAGGDADTLDGINSTQFLRSDTADTKTSGDLKFSDNVKATFGAANDLGIYHDGSNSYIADTGTGNLKLLAGNLRIKNSADNENMITADQNGAVNLYYNNSTKLATTTTGVDITGNIVVSGNVDGRNVATDGTKLDGIEAGAEVNPTASELLTSIKTVDGTGSGLDADTLDGQHASAFLTSVASNSIGATELNVTGNGTAGQALTSDGDGSFSWADAGGADTVLHYSLSISSSQTVTIPANTKALVIAVGGGGGGGAGAIDDDSSSATTASGGGSGGWVAKLLEPTSDLDLTITVGAGGLGRSVSDASESQAATAGGSTTVTGTGVSLTAGGGGAGNGVRATSNSVATSTGGTGGTASGGDTNTAGQAARTISLASSASGWNVGHGATPRGSALSADATTRTNTINGDTIENMTFTDPTAGPHPNGRAGALEQTLGGRGAWVNSPNATGYSSTAGNGLAPGGGGGGAIARSSDSDTGGRSANGGDGGAGRVYIYVFAAPDGVY